jgi:hypothetical protein
MAPRRPVRRGHRHRRRPEQLDGTLNPSDKEAIAACGIQAGIRKDSDGVNLCLVVDPDQTCSDDELLRRTQN